MYPNAIGLAENLREWNKLIDLSISRFSGERLTIQIKLKFELRLFPYFHA